MKSSFVADASPAPPGAGASPPCTTRAGVLDACFPAPALGAAERRAGAGGVGRGRAHRRACAASASSCVAGRDRPRRPPGRHRRRLPAAAPAQPPPRRAPHDQPRRDLRRRCRTWSGPPPGPCAVDGFERRALAAARRRYGPRHRARGRQVPPDGRLRASRAASGSPTPTGSGWAPTWPRAPPSCTRASSTTTPARSARRWSRAGSRPGVVVGPRLRRRRRRVDHGHAVGRRQGADLHRRALPARAPTPASASRSATTAWSRPASTSPPAPRSRCPDGQVVKALKLSGRGRAALPAQLGHRCDRGAATAPGVPSSSTRRCTATSSWAARPHPTRAARRTPPRRRPPYARRRAVALGAPGRRRWSSRPRSASPAGCATAAWSRSDAGRGALRRHGRRPRRRARPRPGALHVDHRRPLRPARSARRGRPRSPWPPSTRSRGSATSTTATATRSGCSSSGRRRAGAPRSS